MDKIQVISLEPKDWQKYKQIRLEALKNEPYAFARTYEDESKKLDEIWRERLEEAQNENKVILIFIQDNNKIIGMGGIYYEKEDSPLANLWGIYINKEYRGRGLGKEILTNLLNRIYGNLNTKVIRLEVNTSNLPAINLYKKMGLRIVDRKEKVLHGKYDEYVMEKVIN